LNVRPVVQFLGRLLLILAAALLVPLLCSLLYREWGGALTFFLSALLTAACGWGLRVVGQGDGDLYRREGVLIVVGGWLVASLFGALPYLISGTISHPVDALFESASGFTTTGATVLTDIAGQERGILFWRSFTQWLGGMGIIVLFVALLPELGPGARFLYKLEVPGPTAEALSPRIRDTALVLWKLYLGFTVVQTVLLWLAGLNLYDSLTHTFSTLSTGGFSPRNESVAAFESMPLVVVIITVFMILAGGNFSLYFGLRRGKFSTLWRDPEFRLYLTLILGASVVICWNVLEEGLFSHLGWAFLHSVFQVASILTTTGFATADFNQWPVLSKMLLVLLMFVGGCAGSTSGSMKVMRMVIGLKFAIREVRLTFSPNNVLTVFVGGKPLPEGVVRAVTGFFILFLTSWGLGTLLLTLEGGDLVTAGTAAIATLGNVGPGLSAVGPVENFAFFSTGSKLLMILLMLLGRLEVYAIAALFTWRFWRS
jgi:trk system potassium uptake protein TrkH